MRITTTGQFCEQTGINDYRTRTKVFYCNKNETIKDMYQRLIAEWKLHHITDVEVHFDVADV